MGYCLQKIKRLFYKEEKIPAILVGEKRGGEQAI